MNIDSSITTDVTALAPKDLGQPESVRRTAPQRRVQARPFWACIAWLEPFWLALLAPAILLPGRFWAPALQPYLVLALFVFWPLRRLADGRWSVATPLAWPVGILMAWDAAYAMDCGLSRDGLGGGWLSAARRGPLLGTD